jgi:TrmH family RNA methyltransferase
LEDEKDQPVGRRNPAIVRLRSLRRDAVQRAKECVLLAEGVHLAQEALNSGAMIETVVVSARLARNDEGRVLLREIERRGLNCLNTSDAVLESLQDARSPQPILMVLRRPRWTLDDLLGASKPLVTVACGLQDPGNLGTLVRTAEAAGSTGCLLSGSCADPFHPRTVRASAGSILRLPVVELETESVLSCLAENRLTVFATDASTGTPYHRCDFSGPSAILFGGEGSGLPPSILDAAAETARIELRPGVESLSVSAAAAVVLFEAARQRAQD